MVEPSVGVVIPCFNQGEFARESVESALAQDYGNLRVVLLDDASTDGRSTAICRSLAGPRVDVVLLEENLGRALIRNRGVRQLGGVDYVLMLDCDDRLSPAYAATLVGELERRRDAGMAYGTLHFFGMQGGAKATGSWPSRPWSRELMYLDNAIPGPGTMFRRIALEGTEGWRREFTESGGEDFDISLQVLEAGWLPVWVPGAVFHYRKHDASSLATKSEARRKRVDLNIFLLHHDGIRRTCGTRTYIRRRLLPWVLTVIHERDFAAIRTFVAPLLLRAPLTTLALLAGHYLRRLRIRGRDDSRRVS